MSGVLESRPVNRSCGLRSDHIVWLVSPQSVVHYPDRLRRVSYRDLENGKVLVFLTNNFELPALVIAQLYKLRWRVELFFKWIKQNLRIKHFFGTSDNAVKTQVWIAVCIYVLVAILRKEMGLELSLSQMLQILSVNVFEQVPLVELFAETVSHDLLARGIFPEGLRSPHGPGHESLQEGVQNRALALEIIVDQGLVDPGLDGDVVHPRPVESAFGEDRLRGGQDFFPAGRVVVSDADHGGPPCRLFILTG